MEDSKKDVAVKAAFGRMMVITLLVGLCLFGSAGTLAWVGAWIFMGCYVLVLVTLSGLIFRTSPELVAERMNAGANAKSWDRVIVPILAMALPLLEVILAGLDHRFGWTRGIGVGAMTLAVLVMTAGVALTLWAMRVNRFFSSHVRIQAERGHVVITEGPYGFVRHPGYTGSIIFNVAAAILLGSFPALGAGIAFALLMGVRTKLEDNTLQEELAGYAAYASKVRWKLVPFVW